MLKETWGHARFFLYKGDVRGEAISDIKDGAAEKIVRVLDQLTGQQWGEAISDIKDGAAEKIVRVLDRYRALMNE